MACAVRYIGSFPPPLGGVTVKNSLLFDELSVRLPVEVVNVTSLRGEGSHGVSRLAKALRPGKEPLIFGLSDGWRRRLTSLVARISPAQASRSLVFVMGGSAPKATDAPVLNRFRRTYVETEGMRFAYEAAGVRHVSVFPNCRRRPAARSTNLVGGGMTR